MTHEEYDPRPLGKFKTYCPACQRVVRCGPFEGEVIFYRHWLDPNLPHGWRDRCLNSRVLVKDAYFVMPNGDLVTRATFELARGPR